MSKKNKSKLLHDLAIIEYQEYYEKLGYRIIEINEQNKWENYSPDLIVQNIERNKIYFEFKLVGSKLSNSYFAYKKSILEDDPNAEFNFILLNDSYKPDLNIKVPFLKKTITRVNNDYIVRKLKTDKNFTGDFEISSLSIDEILFDSKLSFIGNGTITYSVEYDDETRHVKDSGIEVNFTYLINIIGFTKNGPEINISKITIDKIR